jgi:hypothetical protein
MRTAFLLAGLLMVGTVGCENKPVEKDIQIEIKGGPLDEAKRLLQRYASGQPMASEVSGFQKLVEDVKAVDASKGAILEKGLDDLQKNKGSLKSAAKELMSKL